MSSPSKSYWLQYLALGAAGVGLIACQFYAWRLSTSAQYQYVPSNVGTGVVHAVMMPRLSADVAIYKDQNTDTVGEVVGTIDHARWTFATGWQLGQSAPQNDCNITPESITCQWGQWGFGVSVTDYQSVVGGRGREWFVECHAPLLQDLVVNPFMANTATTHPTNARTNYLYLRHQTKREAPPVAIVSMPMPFNNGTINTLHVCGRPLLSLDCYGVVPARAPDRIEIYYHSPKGVLAPVIKWSRRQQQSVTAQQVFGLPDYANARGE